MSLEQLTRMDVNTASRRDQKLFETPDAVYVITHDDIQRSGATSVPEVLRMVPGLEVAQIDANKWAVSARGFNSRFANKMLIMIDERSIYNPVYSGTLWDQNDLLLDDIDRIEVVRGPGGTMWGANAVNGVINIVTRKACDTRGVLLTTAAGRMEQSAAVRFGSAWDASHDFRAYAKFLHRDHLLAADGSSAHDEGASERIGSRLDWQKSNQDLFSFQGNLFRNPENQRIDFGYSLTDFTLSPIYGAGGYAMGLWKRRSGTSDSALQGYYSDEHRSEIGMKLNMQIVDVDFQRHFIAGTRSDVVLGTGFRWTSDHASGTQTYFAHSDHLVNLFSAFLQDSVSLVPSRLVYTIGSKLQWNSYTHFELQPRSSLLWTPNSIQTVWGAISRAVRTPSDQDRDVDFLYPLGTTDGLPLNGRILGNPHLASEVVLAYEEGYRRRLGDHLSADLAGFVNHYTSLEATDVGDPYLVVNPSVYLVQPFQYINGFSASTEGVEAALAWTPIRTLHFHASYAWMQAHLQSHGTATVQPSGGQDWSTPRNTFDLRGHWNLTRYWCLTAILNGNSTVPSSLGVPVAIVPAHTRADLRVGRKLGEGGELSAGATNLGHASHEEFYPEDYTMNSFVPRSVYVTLRWSW